LKSPLVLALGDFLSKLNICLNIKILLIMNIANKWNCDKCGKIIEKSSDGYVEWLTSPYRGFQIVHHKEPDFEKCQYSRNLAASNHSLTDCFQPDGLMDMLELLNHEDFTKKDTIEIIKRLYVFGYDLCKNHLQEAINRSIFTPNTPLGFQTFNQISAVLEWIEHDKY
jgi:hypothetical protein